LHKVAFVKTITIFAENTLMKKLLFLLALSFGHLSYAQIALPEGFKCEKKDGKKGEYFSDGKYRITLHKYRDEGLRENELIPYIRHTMGITPVANTDGTSVWKGYNNGKYRYIIAIPDIVTKIEITTDSNTPQLAEYGKWMLNQLKIQIDNREKIYLTGHDGKRCQ